MGFDRGQQERVEMIVKTETPPEPEPLVQLTDESQPAIRGHPRSVEIDFEKSVES